MYISIEFYFALFFSYFKDYAGEGQPLKLIDFLNSKFGVENAIDKWDLALAKGTINYSVFILVTNCIMYFAQPIIYRLRYFLTSI